METKIAKKILDLDEKNFKQLRTFISELESEISLNQDSFFYQFSKALQRELEKKRFHIFESPYCLFIDKYRDLLKVITANDLLNDIKYLISFNSSKKTFLQFLSYLEKSYENKDKMNININKIQEIGISKFVFSQEPLEKNFIVVERKQDIRYQIKSIYSDGKQSWLRHEKGYSVEVDNHSYIIKYHKESSFGLHSVEMLLNSLEFDTDTLPSYEELHDINVWQHIDRKRIKEKSDAIDNINKLLLDADMIEKLLEGLSSDIEKIQFLAGNLDYEQTLNGLSNLKELSVLLVKLSTLASSSYQQSNFISKSEIQKHIKPIS